MELETRSEYARFLLVRVSGFLEYGLELMVTEFIAAHGGGPVRTFATSFVGSAGNPNSDRLCRFVGRLDSTWGTGLDTFLAQDQRRTSLNSLVGLRNLVAHGKPSGISHTTVVEYLHTVDDVFAWLLDRLEPLSGTTA
jgi:hypothetical protein